MKLLLVMLQWFSLFCDSVYLPNYLYWMCHISSSWEWQLASNKNNEKFWKSHKELKIQEKMTKLEPKRKGETKMVGWERKLLLHWGHCLTWQETDFCSKKERGQSPRSTKIGESDRGSPKQQTICLQEKTTKNSNPSPSYTASWRLALAPMRHLISRKIIWLFQGKEESQEQNILLNSSLAVLILILFALTQIVENWRLFYGCLFCYFMFPTMAFPPVPDG